METVLTAQGWRDAAINEALRGFNNNENMDALLGEIRRARPESATLLFWPDRMQLLKFLQTLPGFKNLLAGRNEYYYEVRRQIWPYHGWYGVTWEGISLEIVLAPTLSDDGDTLCLGTDMSVMERFVIVAEREANRPAGRCLRYTSQGWENAPELDTQLSSIMWDDVVLPPSLLTGIQEAAEGFLKGRESYRALGFAWKRGLLLIGPPGTGKTMLFRAIASALPELPVLYVRDLNERDTCRQEVMRAIFTRARALAPCILVFEDMDGLIHDDNRTVFLNEMDGFQSNDGLLILASSNHPGKIDEALLKRPSRFDRVFHIGLPKREERAEFCRRVLSRSQLTVHLTPGFDVAALAAHVAEITEGFTPAYLKEALLSAALTRAQEGELVLDETYAEAVLTQVGELRSHLKRMRDPNVLGDLQTDAPLGFRV